MWRAFLRVNVAESGGHGKGNRLGLTRAIGYDQCGRTCGPATRVAVK